MNLTGRSLESSRNRGLSAQRPGSGRQITSHTGIRGVAALLVVAYHQQLGDLHKLPFETATSLFRHSYLMVDLFFVLSGFIISYVYAADRQRPMPAKEAKSFLFTRFARIYPLHLFALLLMTVVVFGQNWVMALAGRPVAPLTSRELLDWVLQLFLVHAWFSGHVGWNIPSWSISAEMFAYLLFPLLVALHFRAPRILGAALLTFSIIFYAYVAATSGSLDIVAGLSPLRCIAGFGLGMLVYYNRASVQGLSPAVLSTIQLVALAWAVTVLCSPISDPMIVPGFVMTVWATWTDRGLLARLLSSRPLQWLGDISYSVYLLHVPLLSAFLFFWVHATHRFPIGQDLSRSVWLCLSFALVLAVSTLTYKFIEVPARRYLLNAWRRRKAPANDALIPAP